jgi:(6-4)DNA photolyase
VEAQRSLRRFVEQRLPDFGRWQDAMLHGEHLMWHSHLSSSLNLGLLRPGEVLDAALGAYRAGDAPIAAVEGFVRQIAGWREYVWGMYWLRAGEWRGMNALGADASCRMRSRTGTPTCAASLTPCAASGRRPTRTTSCA